jgi:hypothetical protein
VGARHVAPVTGGLFVTAVRNHDVALGHVVNELDIYGTPRGGFASLFRQFEREYGDACAGLTTELRESYPDITRPGRRTGRALGNICFFVWSYARGGDEHLIPRLLDASVLLSAQDDYYDNRRLPDAQKGAFCASVNLFIETGAFPKVTGSSRQTRELASLWSRVARPIRSARPLLQPVWEDNARRLNEAMEAENRVARTVDVTFDEYMDTAVHSIGVAFVWSTYLVHKDVSPSTLRALDSVMLLGARTARLSNDLASYRQGKRLNAVLLLGGGRSAEGKVKQLIARSNEMLRDELGALPVGTDVRRALLRSIGFLTELYQRSDFDRRSLW